MTLEAKRISGIIVITIPTIMFGGYFLLELLSGQHQEMQLTEFQRSMFRAGHAHAGVLVILSLVAQIFLDHARLSEGLKMSVRVAFPLAAILISGGFFAGATGTNITQPTSFISILYVGMAVLVFAVLSLGIGLLRK